MTCHVVEPGSLSLSMDGTSLDLSCGSGFVLGGFTIGWPTERPVVRNRSLADGLVDDSRFLGGRAVTVSLNVDQRVLPAQTLIDQLSPFMSPRNRPVITWSLPGTPDELRSLTVRGVDMPLVIEGPKYHTVVMQFLASDSLTQAPASALRCVTMTPGEGGAGRTYNLTFPRVYPAAGPLGSKNVPVYGNAPTPWVATIFGGIEDPAATVNGFDIEFTGLTLTTFQTLVIDVTAKTILLDGDPAESRYNLSNFTAWDWDDLLLPPGDNVMRLTGTAPTTSAAMTVCLTDRWYA